MPAVVADAIEKLKGKGKRGDEDWDTYKSHLVPAEEREIFRYGVPDVGQAKAEMIRLLAERGHTNIDFISFRPLTEEGKYVRFYALFIDRDKNERYEVEFDPTAPVKSGESYFGVYEDSKEKMKKRKADSVQWEQAIIQEAGRQGYPNPEFIEGTLDVQDASDNPGKGWEKTVRYKVWASVLVAGRQLDFHGVWDEKSGSWRKSDFTMTDRGELGMPLNDKNSTKHFTGGRKMKGKKDKDMEAGEEENMDEEEEEKKKNMGEHGKNGKKKKEKETDEEEDEDEEEKEKEDEEEEKEKEDEEEEKEKKEKKGDSLREQIRVINAAAKILQKDPEELLDHDPKVLKKYVVKQAFPGIRLNGKKSSYISALFDVAQQATKKDSGYSHILDEALGKTETYMKESSSKKDETAGMEEEHFERRKNEWMKPVNGS